MMLKRRCYHLRHHYNNDFCNNDDSADDIKNTEADNVCVEPYNSLKDTHFNNIVNDVCASHFDIPINDKDKHQCDIAINNRDS